MKAIVSTNLRKRTSDKYGSGNFGAPRGNHPHNGVDYICPPDSQVQSPVDGIVTKLGYPYGDDLSFRYVEITDKQQRKHRFFYVEPSVLEGWHIAVNDIIGMSQSLQKRYPEITDHIHYEVMINGSYVDPETIT